MQNVASQCGTFPMLWWDPLGPSLTPYMDPVRLILGDHLVKKGLQGSTMDQIDKQMYKQQIALNLQQPALRKIHDSVPSDQGQIVEVSTTIIEISEIVKMYEIGKVSYKGDD